MSADTEAEKLYAAIEESARLVGAPCSREKVRPVLTAFGGSFENAMVVFSVLTGKHHAGQLDYCFTVSVVYTVDHVAASPVLCTKRR